MKLPIIIQGGMGVAISNWTLAKAVSQLGQLGVVSGTGLSRVVTSRLTDGDLVGHVRRALANFSLPEPMQAILDRYYVPGGKRPDQPYEALSMYSLRPPKFLDQLTAISNFVEVFLAREGHKGVVGLNLLEKVQMPNLASLYGAMLAGVDVVLMGAGIPREIPGALDAFADHRPASLKFDVAGLPSGATEMLTFDPRVHLPNPSTSLRRPRFLAIVSAHSLATTLARKANGRVDGFIIEGPTAGGHNAPPRGEATLNARGEPIYGERDLVDLEKVRELGLPFWIAGGVGSPDGLRAACAAGAAGVQVGTLFAYCDESGLAPDIKARVLSAVRDKGVRIQTDPRASPTGYPFKVVDVDGFDSQDDRRVRVCDLGYLRTPYQMPTGRLGYRCPAEPVDAYVAKGGDIADTVGRRCLCNGLAANIGQPQRRDEGDEKPLVTSGDDLVSLDGFLGGRDRYLATDVIAYLLSGPASSPEKRVM